MRFKETPFQHYIIIFHTLNTVCFKEVIGQLWVYKACYQIYWSHCVAFRLSFLPMNCLKMTKSHRKSNNCCIGFLLSLACWRHSCCWLNVSKLYLIRGYEANEKKIKLLNVIYMGHSLPYEVHNCSSNNKFIALRQPYFQHCIRGGLMTSQLHLSTLSNHTAEYILERYGYHTGCMSEIRELQTIKNFHFMFSNRNS